MKDRLRLIDSTARAVHRWQRTWKADADWADVGVWLVTEVVAATAKHLGLGVQLNVNLETDDNFKLLERLLVVHEFSFGHGYAPAFQLWSEINHSLAPNLLRAKRFESRANLVEALRLREQVQESAGREGRPSSCGKTVWNRHTWNAGKVGRNGGDVV